MEGRIISRSISRVPLDLISPPPIATIALDLSIIALARNRLSELNEKPQSAPPDVQLQLVGTRSGWSATLPLNWIVEELPVIGSELTPSSADAMLGSNSDSYFTAEASLASYNSSVAALASRIFRCKLSQSYVAHQSKAVHPANGLC